MVASIDVFTGMDALIYDEPVPDKTDHFELLFVEDIIDPEKSMDWQKPRFYFGRTP